MINSNNAQENEDLNISAKIPARDSDIYSTNRLISDVNYSYPIEIQIKNHGNKNLENLSIEIDVPEILEIILKNCNPSDLEKTDQKISYELSELKVDELITIYFEIKIKDSIPFSQSEILIIKGNYLKDSQKQDFEFSYKFEISPPPSWIIYFTLIFGMLLLFSIIYFSKRTGLLEKYTTMDLINIAILSALGVIVFKWIWQIFNDLLGIFGGLLLTIPTVSLMIVAICLVKKPGTATLFFLNWELVNFIVWGSSINVWLGWYLLEGAVVDICILIFKDYGEKWWSSAIYGLIRCFLAYYMNYYWFAPAIWKIYYAPWYIWIQILIGCVGGIIGGINGYKLGNKLKESIVIS
ncbi:MAG: hypothetical protein ACP6IY_06080 [Promethearchaeia archaeon]